MRARRIGAVAVALMFAGGLTAAPALAASGESCGKPQMYADGSFPVLCANGAPNTAVRPMLVDSNPRIMALKKGATWAQVRAAVCADTRHSTFPITTSAYTYQYALYDWKGDLPSPKALSNRLVRGMCG